MKKIVTLDGARTAIVRASGTIARFRLEERGALAIRRLVDKTCIDPALIEDVDMSFERM